MGLFFRQRGGLAAQHDALAELSQLWQLQLLFQLLLSRQYDLQQLLSGCLEVGQQANFFEHRVGQVLCFVHDEHGGFTGTESVQKPLIQLHQLLALGTRVTRNLELGQDKVKELRRVHPRVEEERRLRPVTVQPLEETVDERRFTCSHFSGERNNPFPRLNSVHQTGQDLLDLLRKKQIPGIRIHIEGIVF